MSASLHDAGVVGDSAVHRLDPRAKLLGLGAVTVIAVSTTTPLVHATCAAALLLIVAVARLSPRTVLRRARVVVLPVLLVAAFTPSVAPKALIGTSSAVLLGLTTSFPDLLHALEKLRAPRLLVLIAAFMYRYLFTIVAEVQRMRAALTARGYRPRHALQIQALGRVATALFLRTYERGERVHLAMLARGFSERMPRLDTLTLGRADALFAAALVPVLAVRVLA
jgi:cobalt/nickel transport system permease protein